jgi:hypothetical protein
MYYSCIYLEGLRKSTKGLKIACGPAEIRTEHHPNSSLPLDQRFPISGWVGVRAGEKPICNVNLIRNEDGKE